LGIFITGPYGFVAGALIGLCIGIIRLRFMKRKGHL
jgi:F0F1-type ATP synthase assembly protein I